MSVGRGHHEGFDCNVREARDVEVLVWFEPLGMIGEGGTADEKRSLSTGGPSVRMS
jgi:hypothetical protein